MLCRSRQWWSCFEHCPILAQTEALESQNRVLTEKLQVTMDRKSILPEMTKLWRTQDFHRMTFYWLFLSSYRSCCCTSQLLVGDVTVRESYQFLFTLMKLKLNLCSLVLAFHFGISESLLSRYITTWVCFLYQHLKGIEWMPIQLSKFYSASCLSW